MKKFSDYLVESKKQYEFKVRFAGPTSPNQMDLLEMSLSKYELISSSKGRTTPIQENPLFFPQIQNCEITTYDVVLQYPVTATILQKYLAETFGISETHILVTSATEPFEELISPIKKEKAYEPLLTTEKMEDADPNAQRKVGTNRVMDLLKELEKCNSEKDPIENTKPVIGANNE